MSQRHWTEHPMYDAVQEPGPTPPQQPEALRLADELETAWKDMEGCAEFAAELRRLHEVEGRYHELLYAVGNKYEGESRHQTALRYIQQAEVINSVAKEKS